MPRATRVKSKLDRLIEQLEHVRLDGGAGLGILPEIREVLALNAVVYFRLVHRARGWALEGFECDGLPYATKFRRVLGAVVGSQLVPPWLDLANPKVAHRNKAVCLTQEIGAAPLRTSWLRERVLEPFGIREPQIVRALLCEDDLLRGWIGGYSMSPITEEQRSMLEALVAPLLERMRIERSLSAAPRVQAAHEQTMQYVRAPALIVDTRGRVHATNRAADELMATRRSEVLLSLSAQIAKRTPALQFTLIPAGISEGTERFLAIMAPQSGEERREQAVALAGLRWQLTPREVHFLKHLIDGASNSEIASAVLMTEQEVEQQISAILNRARVTNRSQLVAAVLQG